MSIGTLCLLVGGGLTALSSMEHPVLPGLLPALAPVVLALGYGALLLRVAQSATLRLLIGPFASVGRMAFSNYIAQSLVCGWVFFGYGLGYFGQLGAAPVLGFCLALFALQAWLSQLWLAYFRFGPLEWVWRSATYARREPLRIARG